MPVPLPPAPTGVIPLPPAPGDPPTLQDASKDMRVFSPSSIHITGTKLPGTATNDDVARAAVYATNVNVAHGAVAAVPAWFGPALSDALSDTLTPLKRTIARCFNLQCHDGTSQPFEIVPFRDGRNPTVPPLNLPALVNVAAIRALSNADATAYVNGYGLGVIHRVADRKSAIADVQRRSDVLYLLMTSSSARLQLVR